MRFLMVGSGGVGGYFGGCLAKSGHDVMFLARGKHLQALKKHGLQIKSIRGNFRKKVKATDRLKSREPFDVVFLCVKDYQTKGVLPTIKKAIGPATLIISLQNGLTSERTLLQAFGGKHVAGGLCYLGAKVESPGVIRHVASGRIILGCLSRSPKNFMARLKGLAQILNQAGIEASYVADFGKKQWEKLIWNIGFNGPTAILNVTVGDLLGRMEQRILVPSLMEEARLVARQHGVRLPREWIERVLEYSAKELALVETSMLIDRRAGRPLEWKIFQGFICREGKRLKVPTPANEQIKNILTVMDSNHGG